MTNTIRPGDRVIIPVEATARYVSRDGLAADVTLHLERPCSGRDGEFTKDLRLGSYPMGNATKVVPVVNVGDVINTSEALAALPGGTILRALNGIAVRRSNRNASVYLDGAAGEVPIFAVVLPLTVLYVPAGAAQ